jgi:xanthine dehydrogenase molybdenum-binding subunit
MKLSVVGQRVPRLDTPDKVAGQTKYGADLTLPGMIWGAVLRARHAHARIRGLDTSAAEKMPGVRAVLTGHDFPRPEYNGAPVLVKDVVRYQGEPIAAVAADTQQQAAAALAKIVVDYAPLPAVTHVCQATAPGAPRVHAVSDDPKRPNICDTATNRCGDIAAGFAAADRVFEDTFETPWTHQGFLETHVSLAAVAGDRLTIWTSTQAQFNQRAEIAYILGLPMSSVRVVGLAVGGAFGGKNALGVEPICAELARRAGRPVKLVVSRRDDFYATRGCGAAVMQLKTGVKSDGALTALQARLLFDTGAYSGAQHDMGATLVQGPYRIPNLDVISYSVYTNKSPAGARRALASPHVHFALESQLDIIAHALGMDPLALRLRNALNEGDLVLGGMKMPYTVAARVMQTAADRAGWGGAGPRRRGTKVYGRGMAAGHWSIWAGGSAAWVQCNEDGTVSVITGAVNLTGTDTSFAQIAAESFGVPLARVSAHQGDTDTSPRNDGSWGSRVTFGVGEAVRRACEDAKQQLAVALAEEWGVAAEEVQVAAGRVRAPGHSVSLAEAAGAAVGSAGAIIGRASLTYLPPAVAVAAQVAEVEVDTETGEWRLLRLTCAQDVGRAINPVSVEGQIEGATSQGLGYALCEEYVYDEEGRMLNPDLMDFRLPTAVDTPEYAIDLIEDARDAGPYGAKGVGEPPLVPTAPAIANAIFAATGARVKQIPITPERLYGAIRAQGPGVSNSRGA